MESIKKQNIAQALSAYCDRYSSRNRAANTLKGVSATTISCMLNSNWEQITDEMWRNVAAQIGYRDERWEAVPTAGYTRMMQLLDDVQRNALVMGVTADAGTGKTFACKQYTASHRQVYMLCCNEYWNRKTFLTELLTALGRDCSGLSVGEMMADIVRSLKTHDTPMLILDEADKLSDQVLYFFITLYNQLEDECGIVLVATDHLEKRIKRGIRLNRKGYNEIWSRLGRKCVALRGITSADIVAVCEANGVTARADIDSVIADCDSDLRRVKRRVHAILRKRAKATETAEQP